jgi:hypothetical protein
VVLFCFAHGAGRVVGCDQDLERDTRFRIEHRAEVRLGDPQMAGRARWRSTEPGHVRPRMTACYHRFGISDWRYYPASEHLYSDIL